MRGVKPLPLIWLLSDARNDAWLEAALDALPRGSGFVFRHYHCGPAARRARFAALATLARERGQAVILSGTAAQAQAWGADGHYGAPASGPGRDGSLFLATAHDEDELTAAAAAGADGVFLSPVFATSSHPGAQMLGVEGFHRLAKESPIPVIALGGMDAARAEALRWERWGAIDGLALPHSRRSSLDPGLAEDS